jgi:lipoprotein-releasing system ATP-binding protein
MSALGNPLIVACGLRKTYSQGAAPVEVLKGVDIDIAAGDCVALLGASGSGKSTLLHCLALLDDPDAGELSILGRDAKKLTRADKSQMRLESLGFVFQFHHLIPELTALENVLLPASLKGVRKNDRARELLDWVGLGDKAARFPWQLSGGEQQRVAVVRSLINEPKILFTDEATGNLDRQRAHEILDLLLKAHKEMGMTLLSVTHDEELAARYGRRLRLRDGLLAI